MDAAVPTVRLQAKTKLGPEPNLSATTIERLSRGIDRKSRYRKMRWKHTCFTGASGWVGP